MNKSTTTFKKAFMSVSLFAAAAITVIAAPVSVVPVAKADLASEISALEEEISRFQNEANRLRGEADTLQNKINTINSEKAVVQGQIDLSQAKYDQLIIAIEENQAKLRKQQQFLGKTLANLYVDSDMSALELAASSKSLSDYMDKQGYRSAIRNKIQTSIKKVKSLRAELDQQKIAVENVLKDQRAQREKLAMAEAEQQKLLADTQGQESNYQNLIADRNASLADKKAAQAAANARFNGGASYVGTGSYPWAGTGGSAWSQADCYGPDPWGMCIRQCVSYTAWKVASTGRHVPYGLGDAKMWDDAMGYDYSPSPGDVAISDNGWWGHAMYVDSVNSDGTINISQYNANLTGQYSEVYGMSPAGLKFITF